MLKDRYQAAVDFPTYLEGVEKYADLWAQVARRAAVPADILNRVEATGGQWHLLVMSEDWCGDAVNTVPVVAALAEAAANVDLRVIGRDDNPDLMDAHLTNGTSRSIPVVIVLNERYEEVGWWGPRPSELQAWVMSAGKQLPTADRYREIRRWYARDRGVSTLDEVVGLIESAAVEAAA